MVVASLAAATSGAAAGPPPSRIIYLDNCKPTGCVLTRATVDDSRTNRSSLISGTRTISAFAGTDPSWQAVVTCVRDTFAAFDASFTRECCDRPHFVGRPECAEWIVWVTEKECARLLADRCAQSVERETSCFCAPESNGSACATHTFCDEKIDWILHDDFIARAKHVLCDERDPACCGVGRDDARRINVRVFDTIRTSARAKPSRSKGSGEAPTSTTA